MHSSWRPSDLLFDRARIGCSRDPPDVRPTLMTLTALVALIWAVLLLPFILRVGRFAWTHFHAPVTSEPSTEGTAQIRRPFEEVNLDV